VHPERHGETGGHSCLKRFFEFPKGLKKKKRWPPELPNTPAPSGDGRNHLRQRLKRRRGGNEGIPVLGRKKKKRNVAQKIRSGPPIQLGGGGGEKFKSALDEKARTCKEAAIAVTALWQPELEGKNGQMPRSPLGRNAESGAAPRANAGKNQTPDKR